MTVYAQNAPYADTKRHPRALVLIVAGHAAVLAAVMSAKMDLPRTIFPPTTVTLIPEATPPDENPPPPESHKAQPSRIDQPRLLIPIPQPDVPDVDTTLAPLPIPLPDTGRVISPDAGTHVTPKPAPVRVGPRFRTPEWDLKPPYPQSKLRTEEEAVLRLRLSIDERGRVTAVEPVGNADPVFLASARRHLIAHWRYEPATEDGRPIASSTVITLRFELD